MIEAEEAADRAGRAMRDLQSANNRIARLEKELSESRAEADKALQAQEPGTAPDPLFERMKARSKAEIASLKEQLEHDRDEADIVINDLKMKEQDQREKVARLRQEVDALKPKLSEYEAGEVVKGQLQADLSKAKNKSLEMEAKMNAANATKKELTNRVEELQRDLERARVERSAARRRSIQGGVDPDKDEEGNTVADSLHDQERILEQERDIARREVAHFRTELAAERG